jgi:hypothetical protein
LPSLLTQISKTTLVHFSWLIATALMAVSFLLGIDVLIFSCYMLLRLFFTLNVSLPFGSIQGGNVFSAIYAEKNFSIP